MSTVRINVTKERVVSNRSQVSVSLRMGDVHATLVMRGPGANGIGAILQDVATALGDSESEVMVQGALQVGGQPQVGER